jgi:hypothetical protein
MKATTTHKLSRRIFVQTACVAACAHLLPSADTAEPVIDIHQHTHYWGRGVWFFFETKNPPPAEKKEFFCPPGACWVL